MKIFQKVRNWRNWILSVPRVSVCRETKSPWLRQYQSFISNWWVNGKVFTSTLTWEPRNLIFFFQKSSKLNLTCILTCSEELKSTFKKVSTCTYMSTSGMHSRPFEGRHLVGIWHHNYWNMALYLLAYGIIFIGIWHHIYWNMASYLLEYVIIFIGIWHHIFWNVASYLLEYGIIFIRICYHIYWIIYIYIYI